MDNEIFSPSLVNMFWYAEGISTQSCQRILIKISNVPRDPWRNCFWGLLEISVDVFFCCIYCSSSWTECKTCWTGRCPRAFGQQLSSLLNTLADNLAPSRCGTTITCSRHAVILLICWHSSTKRSEFIKKVEPCVQPCSTFKIVLLLAQNVIVSS